MTREHQRALKLEKILDGAKDEIDEVLRKLRGKQRAAGARDLIEYIELHYLSSSAMP